MGQESDYLIFQAITLTSRDRRSGGKADLVCRITHMPKVLFG
jgi:hypothetical protein